jgi:ubiquinone/menaquinone biosynthesis C-methylase UbiE
MDNFNRKSHWENIYQTKEFNEVSWYQPQPTTSLDFIKDANLSKDSKIIDIGGGDSYLVDHLIALDYTDITVLDISQAAIERAKKRLGKDSIKVKWIVADASNFKPKEKYDLWHDRAAFHFLTQENEIENYIETLNQYLQPNGFVIIGTFSEQGPTKCSGIEIKQYSELTISERFSKYFTKTKSLIVDHNTPFDTIQNFVFCSFKKSEQI